MLSDTADEDLSIHDLDINMENDSGNCKRFLGNSWYYIPKSLLMNIFEYLSAQELVRAGLTCSPWYQASLCEFLWRDLLKKDFGIDCSVGMLPGQHSWRVEYQRLAYQTPRLLTDVLREHKDQVLHVSFSNDGKMFATCSKDGSVVVWNADHPVSIKYQRDMRSFSWKYTQFSQFNQSDTLLLVSGVHFGIPHSSSGEIAVFSLTDGLELQCRVRNKPYDVFGAWYSDQHLLSGDYKFHNHLSSQSILWLNKASQETASEYIPVMNQMFRFFNFNASLVRCVMVARCLVSDVNEDGSESSSCGRPPSKLDSHSQRAASHGYSSQFNNVPGDSQRSDHSAQEKNLDVAVEDTNTIAYNADYRQVEKEADIDVNGDWGCQPEFYRGFHRLTIRLIPGLPFLAVDERCDDMSEGSEVSEALGDVDSSDDDGLCVRDDKFLIFTVGSESLTPHQIGIKRVKPVYFPRRMDPGLSLKERIANRAREQQEALNNPHEVPLLNPDNLEYDKVDHLIDLHGHIIGMALSPDHRFLYVNCRPWPNGYVISNPLMPPPIAQEIDIHVIDLVTIKEVGTMPRSHKAYTSNLDCFFIFLDVCKEYVASGAEDKHGYLWDRHYGTCLVKYPHYDVVNSVAFNPKDSEMLITVSDDNTIKVWHSRRRSIELGLEAKVLPQAVPVRKYHRQSQRPCCSQTVRGGGGRGGDGHPS